MTLKHRYKDSIRPKLLKDLGLKNIHQVPKVVKVYVNRGLGEAAQNSKALEASLNEMATITGQKALVTRAKKAIAGFKIRAGMPLGVSVTLRNKIMYEFLDRLINIAIPRIRDFRGLNSGSFDGNGNYSFGIKEQIIFPEINYDKIDKVRGLDVTICTTANNNSEALELLKNSNILNEVYEGNLEVKFENTEDISRESIRNFLSSLKKK